MPIHYALFENNLTADPDDYAATVQAIDSADLLAVVQRMIDRGSTTTRADILAVLEDTIGACETLLLDGMRINFGGLVELFPRVRGVFTGASDAFDAARHTIDVGANPGSRVRATVRGDATVVKDEAIKPAPNPIEFRDIASDSSNGQLTPGNIGQLTGNRLKFNAVQPDEGAYFVPIGLGTETKVVALQKNKPSQLVFLVPTLAAGDWHIEVRARISGGTELRTSRLEAVLTVT